MSAEPIQLLLGLFGGAALSTAFILVLFIGFCVGCGFLKTRHARRGLIVRSLDDAITREPVTYLSGNVPRGHADQLRSPELLEAATRKL